MQGNLLWASTSCSCPILSFGRAKKCGVCLLGGSCRVEAHILKLTGHTHIHNLCVYRLHRPNLRYSHTRWARDGQRDRNMDRLESGGGQTLGCYYALRTPEESLPSGAPKEEFGWMIFETKSSLGTVLKFSQHCRQLLVEVRRGAGTCEAPCILEYYCSSASLYLHESAVQNSVRNALFLERYQKAHLHPWNSNVDWCWFYYSIRNSLVALLEALFASVQNVLSRVTVCVFVYVYAYTHTRVCLYIMIRLIDVAFITP